VKEACRGWAGEAARRSRQAAETHPPGMEVFKGGCAGQGVCVNGGRHAWGGM